MASLSPYSITLGATDYPVKYAGLLAYIEPYLTNLETFTFSGGNVGLGVTPSAGIGRLQIQAGTAATGISAYFSNVDGTYNPYLRIQHNSDGVKLFNSSSFGGASNNLIFGNGSTSETMRLDSSGNLVVGKTAVGLTVGAELQANGVVTSTRSTSTSGTTTMEVYSTGAAAYRFYVNMAGTIFATSTTISAISDQRLKENIRDLDAGLTEVMALKPRKFDWKAGKGKDKKNDRGWIAQEFEQVFPDLIDEWKDPAPEGEEPYKAVNADLIPVLVKAIQEQQALITDLRARVAALEAA